MTDISNVRLLYTKGVLFVLLGVVASVLILLEQPSLKVAVLLALAIWSFARAYYFVFYVIEHYTDPGYKFAGLWAFVQYLTRRRKQDTRGEASPRPSDPTKVDG